LFSSKIRGLLRPVETQELAMRAVVIRQFGDPGQVRVEEIAQPEPRIGEALVKIAAAGVNPSDVKNIQGAMAGTTLSRVPGRDFAGTVVSGPAEWVGREVWGTGGDVGFTRDGSHAEFMVVPAAALMEKPRGLAMEVAGAAGLTFVTAWSALVTAANVGSGDTVLVVGANGGVGSAAVQIAVALGARVIGAVRSQGEAEKIRELGATEAIDTSAQGLADEAARRTEGRGADVVFDTTGHLFAECVEAAAHGGRVGVISAPADGKTAFNLRSLYRKELKVLGVDSRRLDVTACAQLLAAMAPGFEEGKFRAAAAEAHSLEEAPEVYVRVLKGTGRFCLRPQG
jgi:NADPH:quinone reductase